MPVNKIFNSSSVAVAVLFWDQEEITVLMNIFRGPVQVTVTSEIINWDSSILVIFRRMFFKIPSLTKND